ncbi:MAG: DUF1841 family protein [bacterium]
MNDEINDMFRQLSRDHMHAIWERAKANELDELNDEDRQLAKIMLEHEDEYSNEFEFADVLHDFEYDPETETNPFLHILIHLIVENQLQARDPIETYQFYLAMRRKKVTHHDAIHLIGSIVTPLVFQALKQMQPFDLTLYKRLLRIYRDKKPERIASALNKDLDFIFKE